MPIVRISLNIDDSTYAAIKAGALELCGITKDTVTKRIAKHIPTVADTTMDSVSKAVDFIRAHKKETFLIGGIIVVGGTVAGTVGHVLHCKQRKLDAQFGKALQIYLDSARDGTLTIEILNDLIISIEAIEKNSPKKAIKLNISAAQFSELIYCIFDFTIRMATANNFTAKQINNPRYFKEKTSDDLKYYLNIQKQIFEQTA